uniref:Uncharacterized protein n=1 Tax=uncultured marine virus TaxID=186617 RepID=A0A0F7L7Y7_9VIRU|nr:hypothetical protein [uncultured marine virus]
MANILLFDDGTEIDITGIDYNIVTAITDFTDISVKSESKRTNNINITKQKDVLKLIEHSDNINAGWKDSGTVVNLLNGLQKIKGLYKLKSIGRGVSLQIVQDSIEWISYISERSTNELDFSAQEHAFTAANVLTSETVAAGRYYVYPVIDRDRMRDLSTGWTTQDRFPSFQLTPLFKKIFEEAGYELISDWIDLTATEKLYFPYVQDLITLSEVDSRACDIGVTADIVESDLNVPNGTPVSISMSENPIELNDVTTDTGENFSTTTHKYTIPKDGVYKFTFDLDFQLTIEKDGAFTPNGSLDIRLYNNGVTILDSDTDTITDELLHSYTLNTVFKTFSADDEITAYITYTDTTTNNSGDVLSYYAKALSSGTQFQCESTYGFADNETVTSEMMLPDMNQLDLLIDLITLNNLIVFTDEFEKKVYIDDWETIYSRAAVVDWSERMDTGEDPAITKLSDSYSAVMIHSFATASGDDNKPESEISIDLSNSARSGEKKVALKHLSFTLCEKRPNAFFNIGAIPALVGSSLTNRLLQYNGVLSPGTSTWRYNGSARSTFPQMEALEMSVYTGLYYDEFYDFVNNAKFIKTKVNVSDIELSNLMIYSSDSSIFNKRVIKINDEIGECIINSITENPNNSKTKIVEIIKKTII